MKKFLLLPLLLIPSFVYGCMPPSPGEVMIGRIDSLDATSLGIHDVGFSSYGFPFRDDGYGAPTTWKYRPYSDITLRQGFPEGIQSGSLIIALSDSQDGSYPHDYSIFHITTLSCEDDILNLGQRHGTVMGWDRKNGRCGYEARSLLDVFPDGDEAVWLQKLQAKYPTCDTLEKAFPSITDSMKSVASGGSYEGDVIIRSTGFFWLDWILRKIDDFFRHF